MDTTAIVLSAPKRLGVDTVPLSAPKDGEIVVDVAHSGISTGTEKLLWSGDMPPFPGMGYPLVPGYEAMGEVVEAPAGSGLSVGDLVFVPGANCYGEVRGLFGGAAARLVTAPERVQRLAPGTGPEGALLALAATAYHAIAGHEPPDLIVGHGVLGRLIARIAIAMGAPAPTVWEIAPDRRGGAEGYAVVDPDDDARRDYRAIYDASGAADLIDPLIMRLTKGGELVLAGFYSVPIQFAFPPAFMKEARLRIAAEWTRPDLADTARLIEDGKLSLGGLITHRRPASAGATAYETAFDDPSCLKMILDWRDA